MRGCAHRADSLLYEAYHLPLTTCHLPLTTYHLLLTTYQAHHMLDEVLRLARDVVLLREGVPTVDDRLVRLHVAVAPAGV